MTHKSSAKLAWIVGGVSSLLLGGLVVAVLSLWVVSVAGRADVGRHTPRDCRSDNQCAAQDLRVQVRMANATETLVDQNFVQLFLALLTIAGLGATVQFARLAWKAANAANEINRDALNAAHRPWIDVRDLTPISNFVWDNETWKIACEATIRNIGRSPAMHVFEHWNARTVDHPLEIGTALREEMKSASRVSNTDHLSAIFPNSSRHIGCRLAHPGHEIGIPVVILVVSYMGGHSDQVFSTGIAFCVRVVDEASGKTRAPSRGDTIEERHVVFLDGYGSQILAV